MSKAVKMFSQFLKDEDGAALIEYTVLLGILLDRGHRHDRPGRNLGFQAMACAG